MIAPGSRPGARTVYARLDNGELRRVNDTRTILTVLAQYDKLQESRMKNFKLFGYITLTPKQAFLGLCGAALFIALCFAVLEWFPA